MKRSIFCACILLSVISNGQDYHAITGSNYAGALGVHNSPASILNTPYPWDLTLVGLQAKYQTNAVRIIDYSMLSSPANSKFIISGGNFARYGNEQLNLNLLNSRFAIGRTRAVAFGVNLRSVANVSTTAYNYRDTITSLQSFLSMNSGSAPLDGETRAAGFLEGYISYAQTIIDNPAYRLNGGFSVKLNRGLAGVQSSLKDIRYREITTNGETDYLVTDGEIKYGYSSTIDGWVDNSGTSTNVSNLLGNSRYGFSFDAGLELIIKPAGVPGYMDDEESFYDYDWKIAASLIDVGRSQYKYSGNSRAGQVTAQGFTAGSLVSKLDSTISGIEEFNDSLASLIRLTATGGNFNLYSPARIVINADRYIYGAWFVNAELSLNITGILGKKRFYVNDMNLLRITPRWETRRWGMYMPVLVNNRGKVWVGAAAKAGPLLFGFHNLANVFSKTSMAGGGGYIALTIRPGDRVTAGKKQKMLDCPPY